GELWDVVRAVPAERPVKGVDGARPEVMRPAGFGLPAEPIQLVLKAVELRLAPVAALHSEAQAEAVLIVQRMVELDREIAGAEGHRGSDLVILDTPGQVG